MSESATEPTKPQHRIQMGMTVYWYEQGNRQDRARPAIVTDVGTAGNLGMQVLGVKGESGIRFYAHRDGVRHIDDPALNRHDREELGAWDYPPWMRKPAATV